MQDIKQVAVRSSAVLTNSYVAGTVIENVGLYNQLVLNLAYTKGSLTSLEYKIEFSQDNVTFYQEAGSVISGGTSTDTPLEHTTTTATANFNIPVEIKCNYIKVSFKGTGTVTNSLLAVEAVLGVQ